MFEFFDGPSSLIYGIGNVARRDDGLGWAFIDQLEARHPLPRQSCIVTISSTSKTPI